MKKGEKPKEEIEKVAVVKCTSYEQSKVDKAIAKSLELIDFKFKRGQTVLIKPNILGAYDKYQDAITTNPSLIIAVCKILKKNKCKIYIGESSFMATDIAFQKSGIGKIAKKYGTQVIFEQEKLRTITDHSAKILKKFPIARLVKQVDLVINMPKMKTHVLADVTLGIKNLYGLLPGGLKQRTHKKAKGDAFSEILVDIYQNILPELNILDGVIGMEGQGPSSGTPKKASLILASKNTVALDIAASSIMDFKPKQIPAIKFAIKRKLYPNYKFTLVGLDKLPKIHFHKPIESSARKIIREALREKPIVCYTKKCIKCGKCRDHCPVKAIHLEPYPIIDKRKCIRCFCCLEICPTNALCLGKSGDAMWKKDNAN